MRLIRLLFALVLLLPAVSQGAVDWDESFEYASNAAMDAVWETSCPGNADIIRPTTTRPRTGSYSLELTFRGVQGVTPGFQSCFKNRNLSAPTTGTLYSRFWMYIPSSFQVAGSATLAGSGTKITLHPTYNYDAYTSMWWVMMWGGARLDVGVQKSWSPPILNDSTETIYGPTIPRDRWVCLETQLTYATPGQQNGIVRNWVDGVAGTNRANVWMDQAGQQSVFRSVRLYTQNGLGTFFIDDYAVSRDARIGCSGAPPPSDTTAPAQVAGLTAVSDTDTSITYTWTANTESDLQRYILQGCTGAACTDVATVGTVAAGTTTFTWTGRSANTLYRLRVAAQDTSNNIGTASSFVDETTDAASVLPTVTAFTTTAAGGTITYTGSPTDYRIEFGGDFAGSTNLIFTAAQVPAGVLSFVWPAGTNWACAHARDAVAAEDPIGYRCNSVQASTGGVLRQHSTNGRWFTDDSGRAIYLAGLSGTLSLPNATRSALQDFTVDAPTDGFPRANSADLGASWDAGYTGASAFKIVSNGVECSVTISGYCLETYTTSYDANQAAQVLLRTWDVGTSDSNFAIMLRASAAPTANSYRFKAGANQTGGVTVSFDKLVGGVWTADLATATTPAWAAGDILRATANGTTLTMYRNGTPVLTVTDASIATGGRAGLIIYTAAASTSAVVLDEFYAWNLADADPTVNDYVTAFDSMVTSGLNFSRMWLYPEATSWGEAAWLASGEPRVPTHMMPWVRTGVSTDCTSGTCVMIGRYNLDTWNEAFFTQVRQRVLAARERGLKLAIVLFEGWGTTQVTYHAFSSPFASGNNEQSISCDTNANGRCEENHTLANPSVTAYQVAYVKKLIDTLNDLDNIVGWEIVNEPNNTGTLAWQDYIADTIATYEATKTNQHLIIQSPYINPAATSNAYLRANTRFDVIVPSCIATEDYSTNPPVADGNQIEMVDTDHTGVSDMCGTEVSGWPWKTFLRGRHPIFLNEREAGATLTQIQAEMAQTITYANKVNLAAMTPSSGTSIFSTEYGLYDACNEYLMYMPSDGSSTINLTSCSGGATYDVEYLNVTSGAVSSGGTTTGGASRAFNPAGSDPMVVYLKLNSITDVTAPVISGGQPNGAQASGTTSVTVTVVTDKAATCKLDPTAGTAYGSMATTFSSTGALLHTQSVGSLTDGNSYVRYVKCSGTASGVASADYPVAWSILEAATVIPPDDVTGLHGTLNESTGTILWQWTGVSGADHYLIEISEGDTFLASIETANTSTFYQQGSLTVGSYTARVKAVDASNVQSLNWTTSVAVNAELPPQITGLADASPGVYTGTIVLTWDAPTNLNLVTIFDRCTGDACSDFTLWGGSGATSLTDSNLTPNTVYCYRGKFSNPVYGGTSASWSSTVCATTRAEAAGALSGARLAVPSWTPRLPSTGGGAAPDRLPRN